MPQTISRAKGNDRADPSTSIFVLVRQKVPLFFSSPQFRAPGKGKEISCMGSKGKLALLGAILLFVCSASFANVINFSGLSGNGSVIPNGYAGFNWANFYSQQMPVAAALTLSNASSSDVFAFNNGPASFSSSGSFTFAGA